jgi:hypothetical protein
MRILGRVARMTDEKIAHSFDKKPKVRYHLEDLGVDGIILKIVLDKPDGKT